MSTRFEAHLIYFLRYCSGEAVSVGNKIFRPTDDYRPDIYNDIYRNELERFFNVN